MDVIDKSDDDSVEDHELKSASEADTLPMDAKVEGVESSQKDKER